MRRSAALVALPLFAFTLLTGLEAMARPQQQAVVEVDDRDEVVIRRLQARGLAAEVNQASCGGGTYSVVNSPDGASVSVLFDNFTAKGVLAV